MSVKTLSNITEVRTVRSQDAVNKLLEDGWILLTVSSVAIDEGRDSWILTEFTVGMPTRDSEAA